MSNYDDSFIRPLFSITAFSIGIISVIPNILAVIAITRIRGSLPVNIRLVCCLVAFDLFIAIVVICEASISWNYYSLIDVAKHNGTFPWSQPLPNYHPCLSLILHVMRYTGYNGTLLSLTTLASDLYVAIMYPLNYSSLMRKDRVNFIIAFIVVIALLFGTCELYLPMNYDSIPTAIKNTSYCFYRWFSHMKSSFASFGIILISIIVVSVVYITVFYQIRNFHKHGVRCIHHTNQDIVVCNNTGSNPKRKPNVIRESSSGNNLKKNQRGLTTTLVLLLVFLGCFLPSFIIELHLTIAAGHEKKAYQNDINLTSVLMNLPLICSALDPILYSYRLKDIQLSYFKIFCCRKDEKKSNLPKIIGCRTRQHPTIAVYQPVHRRSIACTSPNSNLKQSLPWSQRLANATGIYIERIRKISSRRSSSITNSHKCTPVSAPAFNQYLGYESTNEASPSQEISQNPYYTVPADFSMTNADFTSPPKMVLSPWNFANKSLRKSWLNLDPLNNDSAKSKSVKLFDRKQKCSRYSSFECRVCSGNSASIDSANTNSTGTAGSYNQNRSQSYDSCQNKSLKIQAKLTGLSNKNTE